MGFLVSIFFFRKYRELYAHTFCHSICHACFPCSGLEGDDAQVPLGHSLAGRKTNPTKTGKDLAPVTGDPQQAPDPALRLNRF